MNKNTSRLALILSMSVFGTIALFVRNIALPSAEVALYRAVLAILLIGGILLVQKKNPVSGVTKKRNEETGEYFAVEELKKLENFRVGMTWKAAGGTMAVYNDNDDFDYTDESTGRKVHVTKNVSIIPTTYKMTYSRDYEQLLGEIKLYGEYKSERE